VIEENVEIILSYMDVLSQGQLITNISLHRDNILLYLNTKSTKHSTPTIGVECLVDLVLRYNNMLSLWSEMFVINCPCDRRKCCPLQVPCDTILLNMQGVLLHFPLLDLPLQVMRHIVFLVQGASSVL
jgi:hypothetical protein